MTKNSDIATLCQVIEARIFASADPVSSRELEKHLPEGVALDTILAEIADRFGDTSGIELKRIGTAWAFRTKPEIASLLTIEKHKERPLSRAALEVMAIIAYHQPVTRAEIEEIRGVSISSGTIDILLEQGWIKPKGRRRTPGKPLTWGTTEGFLDHFGLDDITALPGLDDLKEAGLLRSGQSISDRGGLSTLLAGGDDDSDDDDEHDETMDEFPELEPEQDDE
ncbi:MAG: SMC-Scp complex subunit ScpB [Candidatus Puniceispirillales bacterium]